MKPIFLFLTANLEKLLRLGPAGFLAFIWLSTPGIAGLFLLYELGTVSEWLHARGDAGLLLYAVVFMVTSGIGLLPTTAQAVLGGWVFGPVKGLSAAVIAFGGAALPWLDHYTSCRRQTHRTLSRNKGAGSCNPRTR